MKKFFYIEKVRKTAPLLHFLTNYVTVNDVANAVLAVGASPIMSDEIQEVADLVTLSDGVCLNIGTLTSRTIESMKLAGKTAQKLNKTVIFDPVGAGASTLRTDVARAIVRDISPTVIRGNISEIKAIFADVGTTRGVDAAAGDTVTEQNLPEMVQFAKETASKSGAVIAITGAIDLVSDSEKCYVIRNGCAEMSRITGTGCQLSGICTAFAAANRDDLTAAVACAVMTMGIAGELSAGSGNVGMRNRIIDTLCVIDDDTVERNAKYEIR